VGHFNLCTQLFRKQSILEKNVSDQVYGFEGAIRWYHWFVLEESFEGYVKVTSIFLNATPYFLLHILVADLESFPKHN